MIYVFVLFHIVISKWSQKNLVRRCRKPNELTKLHTYFYKLANKYDVAVTWKLHYPPTICDLCITEK